MQVNYNISTAAIEIILGAKSLLMTTSNTCLPAIFFLPSCVEDKRCFQGQEFERFNTKTFCWLSSRSVQYQGRQFLTFILHKELRNIPCEDYKTLLHKELYGYFHRQSFSWIIVIY